MKVGAESWEHSLEYAEDRKERGDNLNRCLSEINIMGVMGRGFKTEVFLYINVFKSLGNWTHPLGCSGV